MDIPSISMPSMAQSGVTAGFGDVINSVKTAAAGAGSSVPVLALCVAGGLALAWLLAGRKGA